MPGPPDTRIERTPDGRRLVVRRRVAASPAAVWGAFRDTRCWPEWGPSVRAVDCEDRYVERGSTGHVTTVGGLRLPFEVTGCADGRWTWDVARLPATVSTMTTGRSRRSRCRSRRRRTPSSAGGRSDGREWVSYAYSAHGVITIFPTTLSSSTARWASAASASG